MPIRRVDETYAFDDGKADMSSERALLPRLLRAAPLLAAIVALIAIGAIFGVRSGEAALRASIRLTARFAVLVFAVTFATSSLHTLARASWSKALLAGRRQLGLAFAVIQFIHLGFVVALAALFTASFRASVASSSLIGGSLGYLWLAAMTATSFDGPARAIGRRGFRVLHTSGMYLLWGIFLASFAGRAARSPLYAVITAMLLASLCVRVVARFAAWRRRATLPTA